MLGVRPIRIYIYISFYVLKRRPDESATWGPVVNWLKNVRRLKGPLKRHRPIQPPPSPFHRTCYADRSSRL